MSVDDDRHALEIENSENEQRKEFTMRERWEMYLKRYAFLKETATRGAEMRPSVQAARDVGIGTNTIVQIRAITEHESELDPQDIACRNPCRNSHKCDRLTIANVTRSKPPIQAK